MDEAENEGFDGRGQMHEDNKTQDNPNLVVVLQKLQEKVAQLAAESTSQRAAFENLKEDILLNTAEPADGEGEQHGVSA